MDMALGHGRGDGWDGSDAGLMRLEKWLWREEGESRHVWRGVCISAEESRRCWLKM